MNKTSVWTPLWSKGLITEGKVSKFWKVEDAVIQKIKYGGQKKLHGLQGTLERATTHITGECGHC